MLRVPTLHCAPSSARVVQVDPRVAKCLPLMKGNCQHLCVQATMCVWHVQSDTVRAELSIYLLILSRAHARRTGSTTTQVRRSCLH